MDIFVIGIGTDVLLDPSRPDFLLREADGSGRYVFGYMVGVKFGKKILHGVVYDLADVAPADVSSAAAQTRPPLTPTG